jgi:hypothetical protein
LDGVISLTPVFVRILQLMDRRARKTRAVIMVRVFIRIPF